MVDSILINILDLPNNTLNNRHTDINNKQMIANFGNVNKLGFIDILYILFRKGFISKPY